MRFALVTSAAMFALVATVAHAQVWVYSVCGMKLNQFTGQTDSSLPTARACIRILDAKTKVVASRRQRDRVHACHTLDEAVSSLAAAKTNSGLLWFGDFVCTINCEGHEAGYDWARRETVESGGMCPQDRGLSFKEGCWQRVREIEFQQFVLENCQFSN